MQIKQEKQGDMVILAIDEHLDTATSPELESHLLGLIEGGESRVLVDCSALEYVNSAGLKVLLVAAKKLEASGGHFALCTLSPGVLMVFETIGFTRIMKIAVTREDGLQLLRGSG